MSSPARAKRAELKFSHLTDDFHLALGRVTESFAALEAQLKLVAGLLLDRADVELGQIVTAEQPFRGLVALVSSLTRYRIGDGPRLRELEALLSRASDVEARRNRVTHSGWDHALTSMRGDPRRRARVKLTARKGKGLVLDLQDMRAAEIDEIAVEADTVTWDITIAWGRLAQEHRTWGTR